MQSAAANAITTQGSQVLTTTQGSQTMTTPVLIDAHHLDHDHPNVAGSNGKRTAKKKVALVFGYIGTEFCGLQLNDGVRTVDEVLEEVLFKTGCIADYNHEAGLQKVQWSRSSRTDKGVHAAVNVVALKIMGADDPNLVPNIRKLLPDDVRLYDLVRVTKSFHSKQCTTSREYEYVLPTFMLQKFSSDSLSSDNTDYRLSFDVPSSQGSLSQDILKRFNAILSAYLGTKNYHNFTSRTSSFDSSANRYITKCEAELVQTPDGDLVCISIHGQAFLLNQIRKMIGTALSVFHGTTDRNYLFDDELFDSKKRFKLPIAPALGLFLQRPLFRDYNLKINGRHDIKPLDFSEFEEEISSFANIRIYREIIAQDKKQKEFSNWLSEILLGASSNWNSCIEIEEPPSDVVRFKKKQRIFRNQW